MPKKVQAATHSDKLYEGHTEKEIRREALKQKIKEEQTFKFEPVLVTKKSALSKRNLKAMQDGKLDQEKKSLAALDFEERNLEF